MYASLSTTHFPLADEPHVEPHYNGSREADAVSIACHLTNNLYVSFQPEEALRFAAKLVEVATEADAMQRRINAVNGIAPPALVPVGHEDYPEEIG